MASTGLTCAVVSLVVPVVEQGVSERQFAPVRCCVAMEVSVTAESCGGVMDKGALPAPWDDAAGEGCEEAGRTAASRG